MAIGLPIISKFDDKGVKDAGKAIGDFGNGLKKIAGLLVAAFAVDKIKDFAVEAVKAAEGVQQANNRLQAVATSMGTFGDSTQQVTQRMIQFAESKEMLLGVDAEVLKSTQAQLLTFENLAKSAGTAGGMFDRATVAAADMAAVFGGTADQNAVKLGKALQDPVKGVSALTRVGVTFTAEQKKLIEQMVNSNNVLGAQDYILKTIEKQVGGTAAATATASEKMKLAFDNVKESVGMALLPVFEDLTAVLLPLIQDVTPELQKFFEELSPYLMNAVDGFGELAQDALPVVSDALKNVSNAFESVGEFLSPLVEEGGALPALQTIFANMQEPLEAVLGFLKTLGETVLVQVNDIISSEDFQNGMAQLAQGFADVTKELDLLLQQEIVQFLIDLTQPLVVNGIGFLNFQLDRLSIALEAINYALDSLAGKAKGMSMLEKLVKAARFFGVPIPDMFNINFTPKEENFRIPDAAKGGIVKARPGGTIVRVGEAGQDEAIVPLGRGGMGNSYNITINAGVGSDPVAIGRFVTDAIKRYENVSGQVFARA